VHLFCAWVPAYQLVVCTHAHTHSHAYTYIHTHTRAQTSEHAHIYTHTHTHTRSHACNKILECGRMDSKLNNLCSVVKNIACPVVIRGLYSVLPSVAECCRVLQCAAVCCSVLQCTAVCCSVL